VHCKVALDNSPENEITPAELRRFLPQLIEAGAFQVNLTGGEIFSRPDIMELLETIFSFDLMVNIQTNATLIRGEHIELLKKNIDRVVRIAVSIYAGDPEIHDGVTGVTGSWEKSTREFFEMRDAGLEVAAFCLLMKENSPHWNETKDFFESNKMFYQFASLMVAREDGCMQPLEHSVPDESLGGLPVEWDRFLNPDPGSIPAAYDGDTRLSEWCVAARYPCILPNADVVPCQVIRRPVGNLRETPFAEIWRGSPLLDEIRALRVRDLDCRKCEFFPRCKPCIGIAFDESGSFTSRPEAYCKLTHKFMKKETH